ASGAAPPRPPTLSAPWTRTSSATSTRGMRGSIGILTIRGGILEVEQSQQVGQDRLAALVAVARRQPAPGGRDGTRAALVAPPGFLEMASGQCRGVGR